MKKLLSIVLCIILCSQMFVFGGANIFVSANTTDPFFASDVWTEERPASDGFYGNSDSFTSTLPTISDGVLKFVEGNAVQFHWKQLGSDFTTNAKDKTFIFKFDLKITNKGNGTPKIAGSTREFYFAAGGTHFIVDYNDSKEDQKIRTHTTAAACSNDYRVNEVYSIETVWTPSSKSVFTTIKIGDEIICQGTRQNNYGDLNTICSNFVIRCEDGAIEIDNFSFSDGTNTYTEDFERVVIETPVSTTNVQFPENNYAEYSCKISHTDAKASKVVMGEKELFSLENGVMKLATVTVNGTYGAGDYTVNAHINPIQEMVNVEVVLPDGGVVRRGTFELIDASITQGVIDVYAAENSVSNVNCVYKAAQINDYALTTTEPVYEGFEANVYNLVTSFSDAATTRAFAWTALANFIGDNDMQVKYRIKGTDIWDTADAVREIEATETEDEEYFKADITGLTPNTEYEYKIGVKDSMDEENQWGNVYTFKTASGKEDEFSFIAISDTQGYSWNGNSPSNTGFMYAKEALNQALLQVENPAFIMHAGDMVQDGDNKAQWNFFFKSLGDTAKSVPFFGANGNHDVRILGGDENPNIEFYFDLHFNHPNNGGIAALDKTIVDTITNPKVKGIALDADETIYSYNYGDVHFVVLNSGALSGRYDRFLLEAQREWLKADLEANACAKWTVVMVHQPVYHRLGVESARETLYNVFEEYGVDLVIQGHSHLVARSYPMKNGEIATKQNPDLIEQGTGTVYTTIGATSNNHDKIMDSVSSEECFMVTAPAYTEAAYTSVDVSDEELTLTIKQLNGLVLDKFTITADKEKSDHAGEENVVGKLDATCEDDGYTGDTVCTLCGKVIKQGEKIESSGHSYSQEAVMTPEGYVRTCHCRDTETTPYTVADITKVRDAILCGDDTFNIRQLVMVYKGVVKTKQ